MSLFQMSLPSNLLELFSLETLVAQGWHGFPVASAWRKLLEAAFSGDRIREVELALRQVRFLMQSALLVALREVLQALDERLRRSPCPCCLRPMWKNRKEELTLQFLEGEIKILRYYCECPSCGAYMHPLDVHLGLPAKGECTPQFGQDLCLLAVHLPTKSAIELLRSLTGRELGATTLQQELQRNGDALHALEVEEAEALWPWGEKGQIRQIAPPAGTPLRQVPKPGRALIVEQDGVLGNLGRDKGVRAEIEEFEALKKALEGQGKPLPRDAPSRFREVRQARFYRLEDRVTKRTRSGKRRVALTRSETISVVNDPAYFRKRVQAVAHVWEADRYQMVVTLGDGGSFIWEISGTILKADFEILDIQHAKSHIHGLARALFGERTPEATAWARTWCSSIYEKGPDPLLAELTRLEQAGVPTPAQRVLKNLTQYVTEHRHRMDYPKFRSLGLPIASGAIESANRQVVGDRCKRSGMRWSRAGLQRLLSLRAAYLSGNWEMVFAAIRQRRATKAPKAGKRLREDPVEGRRTDGKTNPPSKKVAPAPSRTQSESIPEGIPPRKIVSLLRSGYLRRTAAGTLEVAA